MKADPSNLLNSLSNNDATFFIPPYQRNYEWKESTCAVFFDDIKKVADNNAAGIRAEHFFGSIVYVVEESGFGVPAKYVLTDGQQRITTTMLLLMALRDSVEDEHYKETIQTKYVQNKNTADDSEFKIKLKQVETDWEAYRLLALNHEVPENLRTTSVYRNYSFFKRILEPLSQTERKSLLEHGLSKFQIIAIQLEPTSNPWENPQEIFESMNSLGQPLSLADLVRNYLLMGKSSQDQTNLYNEYWLKLEKKLPGRLSEFIRDWMQADQHKFFKVAKESNFKELYGNFKELVFGRDLETVFGSFVRFSTPYAQANGLEKTGNAKIDALIFDLNAIGVGTAYSFLTEVLDQRASSTDKDEAVIKVLTALRTYVLRRRILQLSAGENKFFPTLGSRAKELCEDPQAEETMFKLLSSFEYALRLPNNSELTSRFETMNFYNFGVAKSSPRLLLSLVEEHLTKARPAWDDEKLQLEHIMPQTLDRVWRKDLGEKADEDHKTLLNNIGNITLIRHNQELGNKPFDVKREVYASKSGLQVTQNKILDRTVWDAAAISRRAKYIIGLLVNKVLGIPEELQQGNNWKQATETDPKFDSKVVLNHLIGETIAYLKDPRITAIVKSSSTVLYEGKEWKLSPLTKELRKRNGEDTDGSSYHGAYYWTHENTKLVDLDLD